MTDSLNSDNRCVRIRKCLLQLPRRKIACLRRSRTYCNAYLNVVDTVTTYTRLDPSLRQELQTIVDALSAPGKGILAIDESPSSLNSRFHDIDVENTEDTRRDYRQMLLSADKSKLSQYVSGVILNPETVYQKTSEGNEFVDYLRERNIIPGVKVDKGTVCLFGTQNESTTEGLDSLQERCIQYKRDGCHFANWRCTYKLSDRLPSKLAIFYNANVLARYATIAQSARMVPIVEPEIQTTGDHEMLRALEVHEEVLSIIFRTLQEHHVFLEGMILKPAMVLAGIQNTKFSNPHIVADFTLTVLRRTVPSAVPLIMFLSGGQSDEDATVNLNEINRAAGKKPWVLTFCYGRALHDTAMKVWKGQSKNIDEAQSVFLQRAQRCSEASLGKLNVEEFEKCTSSPTIPYDEE